MITRIALAVGVLATACVLATAIGRATITLPTINQIAVTCGTSSTSLLAGAAAARFVFVSVPATAANGAWFNWAGSAAVTAPPSEYIPPGGSKTWEPVAPQQAMACIATAAVAVTVEYQ